MDRQGWLKLLRSAGRHARRSCEAEDLLQTALLAALEAGRGDLGQPANRRWLAGVLRNRALHEARSAVRRRRREAEYQRAEGASQPPPPAPEADALVLPPGLHLTALLILSQHSRAEIAWLLNLSDAALRQRLHQIRLRARAVGLPGTTLDPSLPLGPMRRALVRPVRAGGALGSHDPDGHLFVVTSRNARPRQQDAPQP